MGIPSYLLTYNYIGSSRAGKVVFIVAMPIFAFMVYSKNELPLEKYLLVVWRHRFRPKKRVYRSEITYATIAMGEEENEQLEKRAEKKQSARKENNPKPRKANKKRHKKNVSADIAIQDDL